MRYKNGRGIFEQEEEENTFFHRPLFHMNSRGGVLTVLGMLIDHCAGNCLALQLG